MNQTELIQLDMEGMLQVRHQKARQHVQITANQRIAPRNIDFPVFILVNSNTCEHAGRLVALFFHNRTLVGVFLTALSEGHTSPV